MNLLTGFFDKLSLTSHFLGEVVAELGLQIETCDLLAQLLDLGQSQNFFGHHLGKSTQQFDLLWAWAGLRSAADAEKGSDR